MLNTNDWASHLRAAALVQSNKTETLAVEHTDRRFGYCSRPDSKSRQGFAKATIRAEVPAEIWLEHPTTSDAHVESSDIELPLNQDPATSGPGRTSRFLQA